MFTFFDIILILIIAGFTFFGFWFGLLRALTSLIAFVVGTYLASILYTPITERFFADLGSGQKMFLYIALFFVISKVLFLIFDIFERTIGLFTKLPFVKTINKLLGVIFGFTEGIVTAALVVYVIERYPLGGGVMDALAGSQIAPMLSVIAGLLVPLLPDVLNALNSSVDYATDKYLGSS